MEIVDPQAELHRLLGDLAKFIAMYEQTDDRLSAKQEITQQQIQHFSDEMAQESLKIRQMVAELSEIMTAAGAARWRIAAEQALKQGEEHAKHFELLVNEFRAISEKCAIRLEKISIEAEKRISGLLVNLAIEQDKALVEFRKKADENHNILSKTTNTITGSLKKANQWLNLERMGMAFGAALIASLITGIYINAEWPWESNTSSTSERDIGKALIAAWPTLNAQQKVLIIKSAHLDIKTLDEANS